MSRENALPHEVDEAQKTDAEKDLESVKKQIAMLEEELL